jgi:mannosyl-3-phosphoglycerate phosphatase
MAWVVFTDLDGTLLDSEYSFEEALDTLLWLENNNIPVVFCSSKTKAEIEVIRKELNNNHPFISENGGGVFIPLGYFAVEGVVRDNYVVIELGIGYDELREKIKEIEREVGCRIIGFGDLSIEDIMKLTGLGVEEAVLAK